jgi:hypothetical protein
VTYLELSHPTYTDDIVDEVCKLRQLKQLSLINTKITHDGVQKIRDSFRDTDLQMVVRDTW